MYTNSILIRLTPIHAADADGYPTTAYEPSGDTYPADRQPYSPAAAFKEYGIDGPQILYRCYLPPSAVFSVGDPVKFASSDTVYTVAAVHTWAPGSAGFAPSASAHTEVILSCPK